MKLVRSMQYERVKEFRLEFISIRDKSCSIAIPCDAVGVVERPLDLSDAAVENLLRGLFDSRFQQVGVTSAMVKSLSPGELICDCGRVVYLCSSWYNTCDSCGQGYNGSGQRLAPPSQWGEETGERFSDSGALVL